MKIEELFEELTWMIMIQEKEIQELKETNKLLESYIQTYEDLLRGDYRGDRNPS